MTLKIITKWSFNADGLSGSCFGISQKLQRMQPEKASRSERAAWRESPRQASLVCITETPTDSSTVDDLKDHWLHGVWSYPALGTRNWNTWRNVQTTSSPEASGAAVGSQKHHSLFSQTSTSVWMALPPKGPCSHSSSLCKSKTTVRTHARTHACSPASDRKTVGLRGLLTLPLFSWLYFQWSLRRQRKCMCTQAQTGWSYPGSILLAGCLDTAWNGRWNTVLMVLTETHRW